MKRRLILKRCLIIIILIVIVFTGSWQVAILFVPSESTAETVLKRDLLLLKQVASYLEESDEPFIFIHRLNRTSFQCVLDDETIKAINRLFHRGYQAIEKNKNTISFLRWTYGKDFGAGFTYSINSTDIPKIEYLTKLVPLKTEGWYYYESS